MMSKDRQNTCIICGASIDRRSGKLCSDKCRAEYYSRMTANGSDSKGTWREWYLNNRERYNAYQRDRQAHQRAEMSDDSRRTITRYQVEGRRPDDYPRSDAGRALIRPKSTHRSALIRFARGMTISELSKISGVGVGTIVRYERTGAANMRTVSKLADALRVSVDVLDGDTPIPDDIPVTEPTPMQRARWEAGLTQAQLADMIQRPRQMVEIWESGRSFPDNETLSKIAHALNISVEELNSQK
jgi:transcriptional regulator with XRE-family HTH domain